MLTRFPFLAHTGLSWGCFFRCCFRCRFLFALGRVWSPTWPQLGPILEPCWALFGPFLGVVLASSLKIAFRHDFDGSLIDFGPSEATKTLKNQWFFEGFCFFARSLLRPLLDRFWIDFGTKNHPKIGPKRPFKAIENHVRFLVLSRPSKNQFLANMPPTWLDFGPQDGPKLGPRWGQNRSKIGPGSEIGSGIDFGEMLGRF